VKAFTPTDFLDVEVEGKFVELGAERCARLVLAGEGDAAKSARRRTIAAAAAGWGEREGVNGVQGVVEEMGVELVAEHFEPGLFLGVPGGGGLVAVDLAKGFQLGGAGCDFGGQDAVLVDQES